MNSIELELNCNVDEPYNFNYVSARRACLFTDEVLENFEKRKGFDICHIVSFDCMSKCIVNSLNYYVHYLADEQAYENLIEVTLQSMLGIFLSVKRIEMAKENLYSFNGTNLLDLINMEDEKEQNKLKQYNNIFLLLAFSMGDFMGSNKDCPEKMICHLELCCHFANELLDLLYNELPNLRLGFSSWNRSLRNAFDFTSYDKSENGFIVTCNEDCIAITNLMNYTLGKHNEVENTENGLFFYLANISEDADNEPNFVLYSSSNDEVFKPNEKVQECKNMSIQYTDYLENKLVSIVFSD